MQGDHRQQINQRAPQDPGADHIGDHGLALAGDRRVRPGGKVWVM